MTERDCQDSNRSRSRPISATSLITRHLLIMHAFTATSASQLCSRTTTRHTMFSSQLGRVARASSSIPHPAAVHRTATACLAINATPASIQPKQRRYSSSKASSAPNGNSNGAKPLTDASESASGSKNNSGRRSGGRRARDVSYKPKKAGNGHVDGAFETLPRVAGTGHLHPLGMPLPPSWNRNVDKSH